ncbi:MAG: NAD-glutamate dehydrogenase, partial [Ghiorsea sp.]
MRILRDSLKQLLQATWSSGSMPLHARVKAQVLQLAMQVLSVKQHRNHGVVSNLLSHGQLHRHIMVIHCPDQAFYPDAIRAYLQKQRIQPIQQQSILFSTQQGDAPHLLLPASDNGDNGLLLVLHLPAATTQNIEHLQQGIQYVLEGVEHSVQDFNPMQQTLERLSTHLFHDAPVAADLLQWILDDHY